MRCGVAALDALLAPRLFRGGGGAVVHELQAILLATTRS